MDAQISKVTIEHLKDISEHNDMLPRKEKLLTTIYYSIVAWDSDEMTKANIKEIFIFALMFIHLDFSIC